MSGILMRPEPLPEDADRCGPQRWRAFIDPGRGAGEPAVFIGSAKMRKLRWIMCCSDPWAGGLAASADYGTQLGLASA
jgi:hypothetical protein